MRPLRGTTAVRTLVVDDSPELLEVFCALLALHPGIEIVGTARDGVEALQAWADLEPELVLMDVTMPNMDRITAAMLLAEMPEPPLAGILQGLKEGRARCGSGAA